jgi:enoyl-CoA hydratase
VASVVQRRAERLAALSPQAARLNKRTLRHLADGSLSDEVRRGLFAYADSGEHREGVTAFIEKRPPRFQRG